MAGIPPGSGMPGGDVGGVTEPVWGNSGWRGFPSSVSPATTEGAHRAQGAAGDNWPVPFCPPAARNAKAEAHPLEGRGGDYLGGWPRKRTAFSMTRRGSACL